ncbi:Ataxin-3 [Choanephora cucurbitarum]|uniref:ubiquitinyl hydrolase 1 n=1 Tax=Choanephora cucurbitarum TaxID=101091 RepID=A0A1C7NDC4_9FUNG|nr:Ataxin-3 [Choanephora cucurbitarum]
MDLVTDIYFEKQQQDNLCAQHALNVLLQGSYFTAVDLAEIGRALDKEEQLVGGNRLGQESQNYDDSGYFSIQVLQKALEIWNLELIPWQSTEMQQARQHPEKQQAFICHRQNHWFTLRKFSETYRWYNLDSMQQQPTHLSEVYLDTLLAQIQAEGYSIFAVKGPLALSKADRKAKTLPKPSSQQGQATQFVSFSGKGHSLVSDQHHQEEDEDEETMLSRAIEASLEDKAKNDVDEIRKRRLARFGL